jgi:alkyl sulfatase BDS1-like metallo-beta-lactamase superfamily hydrolase
MLWYIEEKKAIAAAEDVTHTLHNTYSLRGAKIREPLPWSKYINEALVMWGDDAEVLFAQHHWPTWGNENITDLMKKQRDLYRYINDQTLNMMNQGMTMREIAEEFELPEGLANFWANRGYYGSVYHDVAATYVLYLGWFDGNPATLHELPPVEASVNYVGFMGGADAVLEKAQASFDKGDYRWVAQVVNHVVFADPDNQDAKNLQADALEQLGYQAESGPWRNFYLTGAQELRTGWRNCRPRTPPAPTRSGRCRSIWCSTTSRWASTPTRSGKQRRWHSTSTSAATTGRTCWSLRTAC